MSFATFSVSPPGSSLLWSIHHMDKNPLVEVLGSIANNAFAGKFV